MLQLFTFIRADLAGYRPRAEDGFAFSDSANGFDSGPTSEPNFPKSLFLIQPLFSSYELNAVANSAQASVPVPESLDLDAWIVPPLAELANGVDEHHDDGQAGVKKKSKKGKVKDARPARSKGKKREDRDEDGYGDTIPQQLETEEEHIERDRVRISIPLHRLRIVENHAAQSRAAGTNAR